MDHRAHLQPPVDAKAFGVGSVDSPDYKNDTAWPKAAEEWPGNAGGAGWVSCRNRHCSGQPETLRAPASPRQLGRVGMLIVRCLLQQPLTIQAESPLLHLTGKRNKLARSQHSAQLRQGRADPLSSTHAALASFASGLITTSKAGMGRILSIWSHLQADCGKIYHWTKHPVQMVSFYTIPLPLCDLLTHNVSNLGCPICGFMLRGSGRRSFLDRSLRMRFPLGY